MRLLDRKMHLFLLPFLFIGLSAGHRHSHSRFHIRGSNGNGGNSDSPAHVVERHDDDSVSLAPIPIHPFILPRELTTLSESGQKSDVASSGDYTCGPNRPCGNEACCGESGWCGPVADASRSNVQQKVIAYWEAWNENKPCGHMSPHEIPVHDITHLIFSFGFVTPGDFRITNMPDVKSSLLTQVAGLKDKNPNLSVMIALGGWTHNDPGKYQTVFSDMVSTRANRQLFIKNLLGFLSQYGFDGVDFDWEYPGAKDRGGKEADGKNFTQFLKELQAAMRSGGRHYLVTYTAPTSYWYLRHFDLKAMNSYVDWINLMSYDLHGIWDRDNPIGNRILGHTNLTEIDMALDLFWRNDIPPEDIVLGIGLYGRSFKLESPSCWKPGCRFSDPGDKGKCTDTAGFLSYREIMDLIKDTKAKPVYDKDAKVNYMVYGDNNWISYDDDRTFQDKVDFANKRGLNGLMMWAIDLDDSKHSALSAITGKKNFPPGVVALEMNVETRSEEAGYSSDDSSQCRVTDCGGVCSDGERLVGRTNSLDKKKECGKKPSNARSICCPSWASIYDTECHWDRGKGGLSGDCAGKCSPGELKLFADQRGWSGNLQTGGWNGKYCSRGSQVFCCSIGNMQQYMDICTWSKCGGTCPSDKQHVLTIDTGGPAGVNDRCSGAGSGMGYAFDSDAQDPGTGQKGRRKLCCPKKDSFSNCSWRSANVCSKQCDNGQITLDLDPRGMGGSACGSGRQKAFCCDAPGRKNQPFLPVNLDKLFPPDLLPPPDSLPQFELVTFGKGARDSSPNEAGIAFFLIAGSDTGLASMSKRDNPNLVFLDCPKEISSQPVHQVQTARVICLGLFEECFGVAKDGVEGTVVHMPTDCGSGSYARAVSLVPSQNQSIPVELARHRPSAVYDFSFDYDMGLVRRDAGPYSLRIDYSNVRGYWNAVVDLTGKKRDLKHLVDRFYADNSKDWFTQFDKTDIENSGDLNDNTRSILNQLLYFDSQMCDVGRDERESQGFSVTLEGSTNAKFFYGFSLIATWEPGYKLKVHQSAGFLDVGGKTNVEFTVAGIGKLDTSQKKDGGAVTYKEASESLGGHALWHGWAAFRPYKQEIMDFETRSTRGGEVAMNGYLSAKVEAQWASRNIHFPDNKASFDISEPLASRKTGLTPLSVPGSQSQITIGVDTKFGLDVQLSFGKPYSDAVDGLLPDISVSQKVTAMFAWKEEDSEVCLDTYVGHTQNAKLVAGAYVGWGEDYDRTVAKSFAHVGGQQCFGKSSHQSRSLGHLIPGTVNAEDHKVEQECDNDDVLCLRRKKKRQNNSYPENYDFSGHVNLLKPSDLSEDPIDKSTQKKPLLICPPCGVCTMTPDGEKKDCCSCVWLPPPPDPDSDIGPPDLGSMPLLPGPIIPGSPTRRGLEFGGLQERASNPTTTAPAAVSTVRKAVSFWVPSNAAIKFVVESEPYYAYPDFYEKPENQAPFDGNAKYSNMLMYYHNTTAVCTSFNVQKDPNFDKIYKYPRNDPYGPYKQGKLYHQHYDTEHVFEGQTISRFFITWLPNNGYSQAWSEKWAFINDQEWQGQTFIHPLVDELGSKIHLDRLAIFLSNSNRLKGSLFKGVSSTSDAHFNSLDAGAEQLLHVRELGLVFGYMGRDDIWDAFCASYNGILDLMEQFDAWYLKKSTNKSDLAAEWVKFIRSELDMVVKQARDDVKRMYQKKKPAGPNYDAFWETIMKGPTAEMNKVKLDKIGKCKKLTASTMPMWKYP
ncbi:glycosyl hydrolases family 18 [Fusarium longipes]|uniref:chitinase n=1 Tax=Fusarium longipes TaxID=694270 RepID=A0A395RMU6_9HYPO|nr:glycosyl hydrolases family 18 [Fusarium longipes]